MRLQTHGRKKYLTPILDGYFRRGPAGVDRPLCPSAYFVRQGRAISPVAATPLLKRVLLLSL